MRNPSLAVLLLNPECRVVECSYERDEKGVGVQPFTQFKTFNKIVKKGDFVVVPTATRYGFTVVRVEAVDTDWDAESAKAIDWLVDIVSTAYFEELKNKEKVSLEMLANAEKRKKREELSKTMTEHLNAVEVEALKLVEAQPAPAAE